MAFRLKNLVVRSTGMKMLDLFQRDVAETLKQIAIDVFTQMVDGLVPAPESVVGKFLSDSGVWSYTPNITKNGGAVVGTRPTLNFIQGAGCTITVADDATNNRVNITISVP